MVDKFRKKPNFNGQQDYNLSTTNDDESKEKLTLTSRGGATGGRLDELIEEYNDFHSKWIERVKQISNQYPNGNQQAEF